MIKQAVDSVENQLDSILDSSIEPPTPAKIPNAVKADDSAQRLSDRLSSIVEPSKTSSSRNKNTSDSQPMTPSDLVNRQSPINSGANTKPNAQITNNDSGINNDKKTSEGNDAWGYDDQLLEIELPQSDEPVKTVAPIGKPEPASNISSSKSEKAVVEENLNSGATGIDQLPQVSVENERETEENEVTGDLSIPKSQPKTMLSEGSTVSSPLVPPKSEPLAKTKIPQPGSSPKEIGSPTDIKDLLEKRESQVLMAKTENSQLHETIVELNAQIDSLKDEIEQLKVSSSTSVEALKKRCSDLQEIVDQKTGGEGQIAQLNRALGEKQASIQGLLQEGEQLAKDILKANNTIKKMMKEKDSLQVKVTELEQHSSALEGTLEMLNSEMKTLKEVEKSQKSQISTLTANNSTTKKRINDLEINFVKSEQEIKELKIQLENKSKLIEEQKVGLANEKEDAIKVAVEEQKKINDSLQIKLNSAVDIASGLQKKVESLTSQLQSSNLEYQTELEHTESQYKTQIKQLESRIALLDAKNYELIHSTQHSKEPLLAQIQQLESQLKFSRQDWQHMESSLLARSMAAEKATGDLTLKLDENRIEIEKLVQEFNQEYQNYGVRIVEFEFGAKCNRFGITINKSN